MMSFSEWVGEASFVCCVNYPTVQAFTHQVADAEAGYGTYQYHQDTVAGDLVNKQAYWTTVGIYGAQWRIVILHVINA